MADDEYGGELTSAQLIADVQRVLNNTCTHPNVPDVPGRDIDSMIDAVAHCRFEEMAVCPDCHALVYKMPDTGVHYKSMPPGPDDAGKPYLSIDYNRGLTLPAPDAPPPLFDPDLKPKGAGPESGWRINATRANAKKKG